MPTFLDLDASPYAGSFTQESWTRRYHMTELVATDIPNAIIEVLAAAPTFADPVPAPLTGLYVSRKTVDRITCNPDNQKLQAWGAIVYERPTSSNNILPPTGSDGPGTTIQRSTAVQQMYRGTDRNGDVVTVEDKDGKDRGRWVPVLVARSRFAFQRKEVNDPRGRADTHTGTVNNALWNGYAANTVLLESVESETVDGGASWDVTYNFLYDPQQWKERVVGEEANGRPIAVPTASQAKDVDMQAETNFALLSITL